ncbi:MAG: VOC family protein [Verrucomicrobiia bacterium]|jgi:catechol 2,3-dioxygenase-like lactoylglutathione lyase family enzyme
MTLQVIGIDHIYVTVSDLRRSEKFYDGVMRLLDFRKGTGSVDGEPCIHYYNRCFQYTLRQARAGAPVHEPLAPGLNHLCFQVAERSDVDATARGLRSLGITVSEPRVYPEYAPDYYAIYFADPDGIRLEIVGRTRLRDVIREKWDELNAFENPLQKIGAG